MNETVLHEEEYRTVFAEITASINSCPLWPPSEGDIEQPPITCQDILRPSSLDHTPRLFDEEWNPKRRHVFTKASKRMVEAMANILRTKFTDTQ